jgi:hypothetical protein
MISSKKENTQMELHFLKKPDQNWEVVSKEEWVKAERASGFFPSAGQHPSSYATAGFSTGIMRGRRMSTTNIDPSTYAWDPEFRDIITKTIQLLGV